MALTPRFSRLMVGCTSGTLQQVQLTALEPSSEVHHLHGHGREGISSVCFLGEDCLVTADWTGVMHAITLASNCGIGSRQNCTRKADQSPRDGEKKSDGGTFSVSARLLGGSLCMDLIPRDVLPLANVLKAMMSQVRCDLYCCAMTWSRI